MIVMKSSHFVYFIVKCEKMNYIALSFLFELLLILLYVYVVYIKF